MRTPNPRHHRQSETGREVPLMRERQRQKERTRERGREKEGVTRLVGSDDAFTNPVRTRVRAREARDREARDNRLRAL